MSRLQRRIDMALAEIAGPLEQSKSDPADRITLPWTQLNRVRNSLLGEHDVRPFSDPELRLDSAKQRLEALRDELAAEGVVLSMWDEDEVHVELLDSDHTPRLVKLKGDR